MLDVGDRYRAQRDELAAARRLLNRLIVHGGHPEAIAAGRAYLLDHPLPDIEDVNREIDSVMRTPPHEEWSQPPDLSGIVLLDRGGIVGRAKRNFVAAEKEDEEGTDDGDSFADAGPDRLNVREDGGPADFPADLQVVGYGQGLYQTHTGLGTDAAILRAHLRAGGTHILKAGATGTPAGAPRTGIAGDFLRRTLENDLYPVDELKTIKWRKDARAQAMRDHLAVWLYIRRNVNRRALATLLDYDRKTIDRLHNKGKTMLELLEQINGKLDVVLERLRELHPTSEEIAATIDDLIADVLGEAA